MDRFPQTHHAEPVLTAQTEGSVSSPSSSAPCGAPEPSFGGRGRPGSQSLRQYQEAQRRLAILQTYEAALSAGLNPSQALERVQRDGTRISRPTLYRWQVSHQVNGFEGLIDRRNNSGRRRSVVRLTPQELSAVRGAVLTTNRTSDSGSVPEGLRLAARRGDLRPEIAAEVEERHRDGRGVPDALRRDLIPAPAVVRQLRNPTDAGLDFLCAPGSLMWVKDGGEERFVRVGDVLEADDATVNFHVCVPWEIGGCPSSERWGVKVARFQWLVAIDRASRYVPGWSYTMRPRSSYRAEDILSLFHGLFRQHGVWQRLCLEQGVWKADQVTAMLEGLHVERMTAWSPHQKPFIEGLFGLLWTKLSDLGGQVGRFRGEEEDAGRVAESCRRGATDPRQHFPMLGQVLEALRRVTAERNAQAVHSDNYGSWVPEERWLAQQAEARETGRLRPLPEGAAWMFAPVAREWTVRGGLVGGSIQVMDGLSLQYDFAAEWLTEFDGAKVRAHFDPSSPQAEATLVLLENVRDHRMGSVLGTAYQVNKTTRYARKQLGWGADDADLGRDMRRVQAASLRSEVRTILPGGRVGVAVTKVRDGLGRAARLEQATTEPTAAPVQPASRRGAADLRPARRGTNPLAPSTPEEFARRRSLTAELLTLGQVD